MRQEPHLILSFGLPSTEENKVLVKELRVMAAKDGWTLSELLRQATLEYFQRHAPGNPQLGLGHWNKGEPFPQTIEEKNRRKDHFGQEWEKRADGAWYRIPR